jgi:hypothetical protein
MDIGGLVHIVIVLIVVGMIIGLLYWLVQKAPFIPDPIRPIILWIILALAVLVVIYMVLLPLVGGSGVPGWRLNR